MKTIHVLSPGFTNPNSCAFLYPLIVFRQALKEAGFEIQIFNTITDQITECDVLLIEHKAMTKSWDAEKSLETLAALNEKTSVIWCDQSDSSGTFLGQVLPYVSKYLKAQVLSDLNGYTRSYYGDRIFTDYYHHQHDIHDDIAYEYGVAAPEDLAKIGISWNSGMMNHGWFGPYSNLLSHKISWMKFLFYPDRIAAPETPRALDVSCRMGISYPRATVRFQRERLREIMGARVGTNKLSRRQYFCELKSCKICLSPFGFGEITLKDFEVFLTGGLLLKPDMTHMRTWPNFYEAGVTYAAHSWDLDDVLGKIEDLLADENRRIEIAKTGQDRFVKYTSGPNAPELFAQYFSSLMYP